jgi:hypothetical protein
VQRRLVQKELPAETLARIPVGSRPIGAVLRRETVVLDMLPIRRITNFVDVLLSGDEPVMKAAVAGAAVVASQACGTAPEIVRRNL